MKEVSILEANNLLDSTKIHKFPRNITDIYKGEWHYDFEHTSFKNSSWTFSNYKGLYLMSLNSVPSNFSEKFDIIRGYIDIADGFYSTNPFLKYKAFGLHSWEKGRILLFGMVEKIEYKTKDIEELLLPILNETSTLLASDLFDSIDLSNLSISSQLLANSTQTISEELSISEEDKDCFILCLLQTKSMEVNEVEILDNRKSLDPRHRDPNNPLIILNGTIGSPECRFQINVGASPIIFEEYYDKALNYVIAATILSFAQIYLLVRQLNHSSTQSAAAKISMLMIGMQANMDSLLCIFHLTLGIIVEVTLNAFITAAFFKFLIFSIFEMRLFLMIWKARNPDQQQDLWGSSTRHQLSGLYARIYILLLTTITLFITFPEYFNFFTLVIYSFWVPQIICNATRDTKHALDLYYIIGMSLTRLFLPLYFYGCPFNFLHTEPNYHMVKLLILWMAIQVAIIIAQDRYGSRFFIPKSLLPKKYDYYHKVNFGNEEKDCVICMNVVDPYRGDYMITPCNHIYHANCLDQWLEQKMICPTCRSPLPVP